MVIVTRLLKKHLGEDNKNHRNFHGRQSKRWHPSITSAQLIAMSSIYAFDVYKTYINKKATNAQIITQSHIGVVGSWLVVSSLATAFHKGGVDLIWLLYMLGKLESGLNCILSLSLTSVQGILIWPALFPTMFALVWKKQTRLAAILSPLIGMAAGIATWVRVAQAMYAKQWTKG